VGAGQALPATGYCLRASADIANRVVLRILPVSCISVTGGDRTWVTGLSPLATGLLHLRDLPTAPVGPYSPADVIVRATSEPVL